MTAAGRHLRGRSVAFLLGKPVERSPVLPDVVTALQEVGAAVVVHVPRPGDELRALPGVLEAVVIALRGLGRAILREAVVALEGTGHHRCCNRPSAALAALDRPRLLMILADAGVPVPHSEVTADWQGVLERSGSPIVAKTVDAMAGHAPGWWWRRTGRCRPPPRSPARNWCRNTSPATAPIAGSTWWAIGRRRCGSPGHETGPRPECSTRHRCWWE